MPATKTVDAINAAIERDGGARFRALQKEEYAKLTDAFSEKSDFFRTHLGASIIGRPCAREIWYGWHWAKKPEHSGQLLRLFNRGHLEEARFLAMLRLIGCEAWSLTEDGHQLRITGCSGHFGGSLDAVVKGIPEMPDTPVLAEFKTHSSKSFASLKSEGVKQAKWEHYVQQVIYMQGQGLTHSLYLAVDKNTDELYGEIVPADEETAGRYIQRAQSIVDSSEPPMRLNSSPAWYQCKFCSYRPMCHMFEVPEINCRTCAHSTPISGGNWKCEYPPSPSIAKDCAACTNYICNPSMLNGIEILEANMDQNWYRFKKADGTVVDTRTK